MARIAPFVVAGALSVLGCGARTGLEATREATLEGSEAADGGSLALRPIALSAGAVNTCALFSDGTVKCWGDDSYGELGIGQPLDGGNDAVSLKPVLVSGLRNAVAISAGYTACAALADGSVDCWGNNASGQLGIGSMDAPASTKPLVVPGLSRAASVVTGMDSETPCALLSSGAVDCWGYNSYGQLGIGKTAGPETCLLAFNCSTTPVSVPGLSSVTALAIGGFSSCALRADGSVDCWGDNSIGQLGNGTTMGPEDCPGAYCSAIPGTVTGLSSATAIAVGDAFACALLTGGGVECWGENDDGQLGNGTNTSSAIPVAVSGVNDAVAIAAGGSSACALLAGRTVACWGNAAEGQLGIALPRTGGTLASPTYSTPVSIAGLSGVAAISSGEMHTCALLLDGGVACWGFNGYGQLGDGTTNDSDTPVAVVW